MIDVEFPPLFSIPITTYIENYGLFYSDNFFSQALLLCSGICLVWLYPNIFYDLRCTQLFVLSGLALDFSSELLANNVLRLLDSSVREQSSTDLIDI